MNFWYLSFLWEAFLYLHNLCLSLAQENTFADFFSFCVTCSNLFIKKTRYPYTGFLRLPLCFCHWLLPSLFSLLYSGSEYPMACILYHWFNVLQGFFCTSDDDCGILYSFITYLSVWVCLLLSLLIIILLLFYDCLQSLTPSFPVGGLHVLAHCPVTRSTFLLGPYALYLITSELSRMTWFCQQNVSGYNGHQIQPETLKIILE